MDEISNIEVEMIWDIEMNPMKELQKGKGIGFWVKEGMMEYNKIDHGNNI